MTTIPEEKVQAILTRAAELDRATMSLETLRSAALEAGISSTAFEQALREYQAAPAKITMPAAIDPKKIWSRFKSNAKKLLQLTKYAGLAYLLGSVTSDVEALIPLTLIVGLFFAWKFGRAMKVSGNARRFQAVVLSVTAGLSLGAASFAAGDLAITFCFAGLTIVAVGTAYIESWVKRILHGT